jgi:hypothetical protein
MDCRILRFYLVSISARSASETSWLPLGKQLRNVLLRHGKGRNGHGRCWSCLPDSTTRQRRTTCQNLPVAGEFRICPVHHVVGPNEMVQGGSEIQPDRGTADARSMRLKNLRAKGTRRRKGKHQRKAKPSKRQAVTGSIAVNVACRLVSSNILIETIIYSPNRCLRPILH